MSGQQASRQWTVRLMMRESDATVTAVAELVDDHEGTLSAQGLFRTDSPHREPADARHELAAARALQRLADLLVCSAVHDLSVY